MAGTGPRRHRSSPSRSRRACHLSCSRGLRRFTCYAPRRSSSAIKDPVTATALLFFSSVLHRHATCWPNSPSLLHCSSLDLILSSTSSLCCSQTGLCLASSLESLVHGRLPQLRPMLRRDDLAVTSLFGGASSSIDHTRSFALLLHCSSTHRFSFCSTGSSGTRPHRRRRRPCNPGQQSLRPAAVLASWWAPNTHHAFSFTSNVLFCRERLLATARPPRSARRREQRRKP